MEVTKQTTVIDVLDEYGQRLVSELRDNLEFGRHISSGELSSSIRYKSTILGSIYYWELFMADYWKFVDKGRRPGKYPPKSAILNWMTNKRIGSFIRGKGANKAVKGGSVLATNFMEQKRIAYLIQRKIAKRGTPATNFYTNAMKPNHAGDVKNLESDLSDLLKKDIKVTIEEIKDEIKQKD